MNGTYTDDLVQQVDCLICGSENAGSAVLCSSCAAPLALVNDRGDQAREPKIVSVIGDSNAGKTVYLGFLLDMLAQRAGEFEAIPKGAFSIDLQQTVISYMAQRMFPPKTPMEPNQWHWAYYQICAQAAQRKWVDLVMPDIAGESLAAEIATPKTFQVISSLLGQTEGLLLVVDAAQAANGATHPDFFAMKMLSYIDALGTANKSGKVATPTAVVLCKSDYCPEVFDNPRHFAQANLNRVWNLCSSRFTNVEFFAASVIGSLGYAAAESEDYVVPVPLHTALQGILEPFEWIIDQL